MNKTAQAMALRQEAAHTRAAMMAAMDEYFAKIDGLIKEAARLEREANEEATITDTDSDDLHGKRRAYWSVRVQSLQGILSIRDRNSSQAS